MKIPGNSSQTSAFILAEKAGKLDSLQGSQSSSEPAKPPPVQNLQQSMAVKNGPDLSSLFSALKLPEDNLSKSLIGFARFFSLPLEPALLNSLRREALNQRHPVRETAALGAAAAADKGLKLGEKALGEYVLAMEGSVKSFAKDYSPEAEAARQYNNGEEDREQNPNDSGREGQDSRDSQQESSGQYAQPDNGFSDDTPSGKEKKNLQERFSGESLRQQAAKILKDRMPLDFINRIPGKNGRWIAVPFSFCQDTFEFTVSMRIFLNAKYLKSEQCMNLLIDRLLLDVEAQQMDHAAPGFRGKGSHWFIGLERPGSGKNDDPERLSPGSMAVIFFEPVKPSLAEKKRIRRELAKALDLPLDKVSFREKQPLFADLGMDHLRSVDEEV